MMSKTTKTMVLDCRVDTCAFYLRGGDCRHPAPEVTLSGNKKFVCWSEQDKPRAARPAHRINVTEKPRP